MDQIVFSLFEGFISLLAILLVSSLLLYRGYSEAEVRTVTFATLVLNTVGLIFVNRSRSQNFWRVLRLPNRAVWWVVGGALTLLAAVMYTPQAREVFRFAELGWSDFMIPLGAGALVILCLETIKSLQTKLRPR